MIRPGFIRQEGGEGGVYLVSLAHPILYLQMGHQGLRHKVHIALGGVDPLEESLLVSESLSLNPDSVGLHRVSPYRATGLENHTHTLFHVGLQPNQVKQLCQDVK